MKRLMIIAPTALILLGLAGGASAETMTSGSADVKVTAKVMRPALEVKIEQNGNVKLGGTIASISGNTLTINSWGGVWTVDAANAKFTRKAGGVSSLTEMKVGDRVMVAGSMQATGLALTAKIVHNESIHAIASNKVGTVSNLNSGAGTFTLTTREGTALQVTTNTNTKFWVGTSTSTIASLAGISATTTVRVDGVINKDAGTVLASKVQVLPAVGIKPVLKTGIKADIKNKIDLKINR